MNDHQLDERARTAAADLRSRAADRPAPDFDPAAPLRLPTPSSPTGRVRSTPALAVAAALILVVGAMAWFTVARNDGDVPSRATTVDGIRPFVATDLPDGFGPTGFASLDGVPETPMQTGPLSIFGSSSKDPGLGLVFMAESSPGDSEGIEPVELGGRTAYRVDGQGLGRHAFLVPDGAGTVLVSSPSLDDEALGPIIATMEVTKQVVTVDAESLPDGWKLLGEDPAGMGAVSPIYSLRAGAGSGFTALYASEDPASYLVVSSTAGGVVNASAVGLTADSTERTTVRGHDAVVATRSGDSGGGLPPSVTLSWVETPGQVLEVTGLGVDRDAVVRVAEGLRPAERDEWVDLIKQSKLGVFGDDRSPADGQTATEIGQGTFPAGGDWRLQVLDGPSSDPEPFRSTRLTVALGGPDTSDGSSSGSSGGSDASVAFISTETLDEGGRHFASGLVGPDVVTVELRRADGSMIGAAQMVNGAGARAWVTELTEDPTILVALDGAGAELDRVSLAPGGENESPQISEGSSPTSIVAPVAPGD